MIIFTLDDKQMLNHTVDVIGDRMHHEDGYTDQDRAAVTKLDKLAKAGNAVVITGADCDDAAARQMLWDVVALELKHWVPGASQRLIYRAANAMGIKQPYPTADDHGPNAADHALFRDWVAGWPLLRCATCCRLFSEG